MNVQLFLDLAKYDGESGGAITSSGGPNVLVGLWLGKRQIMFRFEQLKNLQMMFVDFFTAPKLNS